MASVLHRITKEFLGSVNTPDYPTGNWIRNPDLSAVTGWPSKYWIITGDAVSLMSLSERDSVDAAEAAAILSANRNAASDSIDNADATGFHLREIVELFNKRDNYLVNRVAELQSALDAVKATTGPADNIRAAIPSSWLATNTRTRANTIQIYKDEIAAGVAD